MQEIGQQAVAVYDGFRQSSMEVPANDPKIERSFYNLGSFQSI